MTGTEATEGGSAMESIRARVDERTTLRERVLEWGGGIVTLVLGLGVGLPLSVAVINWVYGIPEHVVWFCETTRIDVWLFWIANVSGGINETPWWW
jgi:hypothetical protein